jgi:PAS domain S-box-containing protein
MRSVVRKELDRVLERSKARYKHFTRRRPAWLGLARTRVSLSLTLLIAFTFISQIFELESPLQGYWLIVGIYCLFNVSLILFREERLRSGRMKLLTDFVDVVLVSSLILVTRNINSLIFLFYFFPLLSVARYKRTRGTLEIALAIIVAFLVLAFLVGTLADAPSLLLKCLVFVAAAVIAGNLTKDRQLGDLKLVDVFREVTDQIIDQPNRSNEVYELILDRALSITGSKQGHMRKVESDRASQVVAHRGLPEGYEQQYFTLTGSLSTEAIMRRVPVRITPLSSRQRKLLLSNYFDEHVPPPRSGLFVPLFGQRNGKREVVAVIAVYSETGIFYSKLDGIRIQTFSAPFEMAEAFHALYSKVRQDAEERQRLLDQVQQEAEEKRRRLKMLHTIGEVLKVEQGLQQVFDKVVELAWIQLNSEEAALFVADKKLKGEISIEKVAVWGPTPEISDELRTLEKPYEPGESYVGGIYQTKELQHLPEVPPTTLYYDKYAGTLPSKAVRHYLGVPIVIGDQGLGVLRVINKRSSSYSIEAGNFELTETGFSPDDEALLQTIASQVASAIRSARFIEVNRYHKELVDNSPDPIIVLDALGFIKVFNEACEKIWGCTANEAINQPVSNYYVSEAHARGIGKHLKKKKRLQNFPARIKACNGEEIPITLSAALLYDAKDQFVGSIGVFKDQRETLRLQEEKNTAEKLATIGKVAHALGHEIKHDIGVAFNFIDALAYEEPADSELSGIYRVVQDSLQQALAKFQNMLQNGRPTPPVTAIISADEIFGRLESSLQRRASAANINLVMKHPDKTKAIEGDIEQLRQVFENLFDNSLDAIRSKRVEKGVLGRGSIECIGATENGNLTIEWTDNGCGIPGEALGKVFTAFVTSKATGSGLGLFAVKSIIESHGGHITVDSEEGATTTFKITIPLLPEAKGE